MMTVRAAGCQGSSRENRKVPFWVRCGARGRRFQKRFVTVKNDGDITWGYVASGRGRGEFSAGAGAAGAKASDAEKFYKNGRKALPLLDWIMDGRTILQIGRKNDDDHR